jgi:hypothetical protein
VQHMAQYMAHSPSQENPNWHPLKDHAEGVGVRLEVQKACAASFHQRPVSHTPRGGTGTWHAREGNLLEVAKLFQNSLGTFSTGDTTKKPGIGL